MTEREPVTAEDLVTCGNAVQKVLQEIPGGLWTAKPPNMTWTRLVTASHICGALLFYATQLANGSPTYTQTINQNESLMTGENLPELVKAQSMLLAAVSRGVPPNARAWHGSGSPDSEGYLAMGCAEVLLHCWDIVGGTGHVFSGDDTIASRIVQRLFPWSPTDTPGWQTLLFATGRGELAGHESPGQNWEWQNAPLDEWDGNERRSDRWVGR